MWTFQWFDLPLKWFTFVSERKVKNSPVAFLHDQHLMNIQRVVWGSLAPSFKFKIFKIFKMKTSQSTDGLERCKFTLLGSEYRITSRRGHLFGCVKLLHPPFSRGADSIKFPQRNFRQGTHIGRKMSFWSTENKMSVINFSTRVLGPIASFYENFMQIFSYSNPPLLTQEEILIQMARLVHRPDSLTDSVLRSVSSNVLIAAAYSPTKFLFKWPAGH